MIKSSTTKLALAVLLLSFVWAIAQDRTTVSVDGESILINGEPTLKGVTWNGISMEGLLPNSRMVQGIFDDMNPDTLANWNYPDTGKWDAERNSNEFVAAMESWKAKGLLAFTINLQGGSPFGYSKYQPWHNSGITPNGALRKDYMARLAKIMDKSDELGMVTILGIFYFGQDQRLRDEDAVRRAVVNTVNWLHKRGYRNVLIEIANECNNRKYDMEIIKADRVHELIKLAQSIKHRGYKYPVSVSYNGNTLAGNKVIAVADFILLHGNGVQDPARITEMVELTRKSPSYTPKPIIFNEDDHYKFEQPINNMVAAFSAGASWGFFDFRREGEPFEAGYQSVPVDWGITHDRKKAFFEILREITNSN
jgi:hypothetical protein